MGMIMQIATCCMIIISIEQVLLNFSGKMESVKICSIKEKTRLSESPLISSLVFEVEIELQFYPGYRHGHRVNID